MDYDSAVNWLFRQEAKGIKFGLENTIELLSRLGDPHRRFRSLHVAGTNGKGSVSAMAGSVLREAGYRTGLYTSPHLVDFRERIRVNGDCIGEGEMLRLAAEVRSIAEDMAAHGRRLTFFELTTAMAFAHFADAGVEAAVVEVGMGGRLDSTNVIEPDCVAIARISLEHTTFLGDTLPQIAFEKAGTMKAGVPVVTLDQGAEVLNVLRERASELSAPLTVVGRDTSYEVLSSTLDGTEVYVEAIDRVVSLPLIGRYQGENCALACNALAEMMRRGVYVPDEAFPSGLAKVKWPGRLEVVSQRPRIILDVSHTADGARTVAAELQRMLARKAIVVLGVLDDKDLDGISTAFGSIARHAIATAPQTSRAFSAQQVGEALSAHCPTEIVDGVAHAIERALALASEDDTVLIAGSLYTVGEAKRRFDGKTC